MNKKLTSILEWYLFIMSCIGLIRLIINNPVCGITALVIIAVSLICIYLYLK